MSRKTQTLDQRISKRIARSKADIFVRGDFKDLGGYDQVGRSLRKLTDKGELIRVGYGLYARATKSPLTGKTVPVKSLPNVAREALARLRIPTQPSRMERAYNEGRITQVPTGRVIAVKGRVSRKIGYEGTYVVYERAGQ